MLNLSLPKIGLRTIKTALSVFFCIIIFQILHRPYPFYACIAAVICTKETVETSFKMGKNRLLGTLVGGIIGILFIFINNTLPSLPSDAFIVSIGILFTIYACNILKINNAVSIACIVFCAIMINLRHESAYVYAFSRILDTFIGVIISLLINAILPNKNK